jgi:hypothetical protein
MQLFAWITLRFVAARASITTESEPFEAKLCFDKPSGPEAWFHEDLSPLSSKLEISTTSSTKIKSKTGTHWFGNTEWFEAVSEISEIAEAGDYCDLHDVLEEALWVAHVIVSEGAVVLAGIAAVTNALTNGAKAFFEDWISQNFFKICVLNLKPSWRKIIMWQT